MNWREVYIVFLLPWVKKCVEVGMTFDEMVDEAIFNLLVQGEASTSDGKCKYRSCTGMKCIVGWMIPDDKYVPEMDPDCNSGIKCNDVVIGALGEVLGRPVSNDEVMKLAQLQHTHDMLAFIPESGVFVSKFFHRISEFDWMSADRINAIESRYENCEVVA